MTYYSESTLHTDLKKESTSSERPECIWQDPQRYEYLLPQSHDERSRHHITRRSLHPESAKQTLQSRQYKQSSYHDQLGTHPIASLRPQYWLSIPAMTP